MKIAAKALTWTVAALAVFPAWSDNRVEQPLTVSIAAPDYWCPYACNAAGPRFGFTVDITRAALESEGHKVVYKNLPLDRALREAESGRIDAVVPAFKGEAPNFLFPSHAVSQTEYCFYVPEDEPWRYRGLDSLGNISFVATSGYTYGEAIDAYIAGVPNERVTLIGGGDVSNRLRELVKRGRFDALLDDRLLFESSQNRIGLKIAGCLEEHHAGFLALSPDDPERSKAIARAFERGFMTLRENGQLCRILEAYDLGIEFVPGVNAAYCASAAQ
ncbi:substrate-binding periplasmic protein [Marinobacter arenosus]|uniref:substrate-binding periplasmic protein n=1 Tax=Marinobacter arenosus TaxID=2856822 RepID=UPI001C4AED9F|nr:transporter substrate-binding domain-containing protein [Marinobacter arenosus]MBW0147198.1 transporter substrate-binding domain-containing protein [Marinobacter arenosus]